MYVVFAKELENTTNTKGHLVQTLEQAFARICCHCGLSYRFEPAQEQGWCLFLTDVERPERSPAPIHTDYQRPQDAQHDLMSQAVDGRIRGHIAVRDDLFGHARIMTGRQGARLHVG